MKNQILPPHIPLVQKRGTVFSVPHDRHPWPVARFAGHRGALTYLNDPFNGSSPKVTSQTNLERPLPLVDPKGADVPGEVSGALTSVLHELGENFNAVVTVVPWLLQSCKIICGGGK